MFIIINQVSAHLSCDADNSRLGPVSDLSGFARGSAGLVQLAWFARGDGARSCCGVGRPCFTGGGSGAELALQKEHALGHTHNKVGVRV